jgi:hypothetical protein
MRCESLDFDQTQLMSEKTKKDTTKPVAAVFGATGYTGRFVIAELLRREMTPIAVARDAEAPATTDFPDGEVMRRHRHSESQLAKLRSQLLSCARLASDFPMIVRTFKKLR